MLDDKGATLICDLRGPGDVITAPIPPARRPAYLVVLGGGIPGAMLSLAEGSSGIGRSPENLVQLAEPSVSRFHARLEENDDGQVQLIDLTSTNGTYLNGNRLLPNQPVPIRDGDRIQFGSTIVVKYIRPDPCEEQFQRELFERSVRDPLTGLFNRAYFAAQIGPLAGRGGLRGHGLAVLMVDADRFKRVNDTYGHEAGDTVLREVADVLRQATRADDLVARFGGEEFVAALPLAGLDQARQRAEKIRRAVAERGIVHDGRILSITVSIGLAFAAPGAIRPLALVSAADRYLYQAKQTGRNRVVCGPAMGVAGVESPTLNDVEEAIAASEEGSDVLDRDSASLTQADHPVVVLQPDSGAFAAVRR